MSIAIERGENKFEPPDNNKPLLYVIGAFSISVVAFVVLEIANLLLATAYWLLLCVGVLHVVLKFTRKDAEQKHMDDTDIDKDERGTNTPGASNKMWYLMVSLLVSLCFVCSAQFIAAIVAAGAVSANYVADHVLMACLAIVLTALGLFLLKTINTASERTCSCSCCCVPFLLGLVFVLATLSLWHTCSKANGLLATNLPPGRLIQTSDGSPAMHIWCDDQGKNISAPTVVFLHGFLGGCLDATWVRRDPAFLKTGLRFCSVDRPGYGYSPGYRLGDTKRHFGRVAKLTQHTLQAAGVTDTILLFHSLGGYHALALAKQVEDDPNIKILAGVAIDALAPQWSRWNKRRQPSDCGIETVAPAHWFWSVVQKIEPTGFPRLLFAIGFNGYDTLVRMLPVDIGPKYLANDMLPKYFQAVVDESRRWAQNCGYAKAGESAMHKLKRLDVVVVPDGVNVSQYALLNNNSNVVVMDGPTEDPHSGVLLSQAWAPKVTKVLVDVINAVR